MTTLGAGNGSPLALQIFYWKRDKPPSAGCRFRVNTRGETMCACACTNTASCSRISRASQRLNRAPARGEQIRGEPGGAEIPRRGGPEQSEKGRESERAKGGRPYHHSRTAQARADLGSTSAWQRTEAATATATATAAAPERLPSSEVAARRIRLDGRRPAARRGRRKGARPCVCSTMVWFPSSLAERR